MRHGELLGMNAALTAAIGVAGTLLGSLITYLFQGRTAKRAEEFARKLRREKLSTTAASAVQQQHRIINPPTAAAMPFTIGCGMKLATISGSISVRMRMPTTV